MSEKNVKTKSAGQKAVVGLPIAQAAGQKAGVGLPIAQAAGQKAVVGLPIAQAAVSKTKTVKKAQKAAAKPKAVYPVKPLSQAKERPIGVKPAKAVSALKKAGTVRKPRVKKEAIAALAVKPVLKEAAPAAAIPVKIEPVKEPPAAQAKVILEVKEPAAVKEADQLLPQEKIVEIDIPVMLKELAFALGEKPAVIIKKLLIEHKLLANLNFPVSEELALRIASGYGYKIKRKPTEEENRKSTP